MYNDSRQFAFNFEVEPSGIVRKKKMKNMYECHSLNGPDKDIKRSFRVLYFPSSKNNEDINIQDRISKLLLLFFKRWNGKSINFLFAYCKWAI